MSDPMREQLYAAHDARHTSKAITLVRFIFTFTNQSLGAPILDKCTGKTREGIHWSGYAVHLSPWRKNSYGDRERGKALCVGYLRIKHD